MIETKLFTLPEFLAVQFDQSNRIGFAEFYPASREIKLWVYADGRGSYSIDLARGLSLHDWLEHLNRKSWASSAVLGDFVKVWFRTLRS